MESQLPSSSSSSPFTRHIFLSFNGDTRRKVTDHLHTALCDAGFYLFRDKDNLRLGDDIEPRLERAIEESSMSIIVISQHYGDSKWCLNELLNILRRKKLDGRYIVFPIFYHTRPSEVRKQKGSFQKAFEEHDKSCKHSKEKIDDWRKALMEVSRIAGRVLRDKSNGYESVFIKEIVEQVGAILQQKVDDVSSCRVGIGSRVKDIDQWLKDPADLGVGVICGMPGIGKTTVAKAACHLNAGKFKLIISLANIRVVSERENGLAILRSDLLSDISKVKEQEIRNRTDEGNVRVDDVICGRKMFLVILDDVDKIEQVNALIGAGDWFFNQSKIIIITSRARLLSHQKHTTFGIKKLNTRESLELFSLHAFLQDHPVKDYLELSDRAVAHCDGNPFALQVMGSFLFGKNSEFWISSLEKLEANIPDERIRRPLELSYMLLDDHEQKLFLTIALSLVGEDMDDAVKKLKKNYFYSRVGMQNLLDRSLVRIDDDNKLIMHPSVFRMARAIINHQETTVDSPWEHIDKLYYSTGNETVINGGSQSCNDDKHAKRKHLDANEDESKPTNEERSSSFKRLCLGFFNLFWPPATRMFQNCSQDNAARKS